VLATGIGSLPGVHARESASIVAGELDGFIHQVELPMRGPGADLIGRTVGQIVKVTGEFPLETTPDGWRVTSGANSLMRRAQSWWSEDADAMEFTTQEYRGDIKIQVCGPWTLAAQIEMINGERMIRDSGASREIAEALAVTVAALVNETRSRVPKAQGIYVQCDEPSLAAVAEGSLRTASGYGRHSPVASGVLETHMNLLMDAIRQEGGIPGLHSCSPRVPWDVVRKSGVQFISFDAHAGAPSDEILGTMWEAGCGLFFGTVPSLPDGGIWDGISASAPARMAAHRLGISDFRNIAITPTCGLAGATPQWARSAYGACREAAVIVQGESDEA
jgi:hypothetical protein